MEMNYCRRCGQPLKHVKADEYRCASGHSIFDNPAPTVGVFFLTDDNQHVLLSERGIEPHKGMLDTFGGFLENDESLEQAAVRELREELGLKPDEYEPLKYLTSAAGPYPFEGEVHTLTTSLFWSRLKTGRKLIPADDVASIQTVSLHDLDLSHLHESDIRAGIKVLRKLFPANITKNESKLLV